MADDELTFNERRLADDFLHQALNSLFEIGKQHASPSRASTKPGQDVKAMAVAAFANRQRILGERLAAARTAVLFAAIAVEAAINYYAAACLPLADRKLIDNLKTDQKLLLVPRLAGREELFFDAREPMGSIRDLFSLRNRIAHPKVGPKSVAQLNSEDFTPAKVCAHIIGAARAIATLQEDLDPHAAPGFARALADNHDDLRGMARAWTDPPSAPPAKLRARLLAEAGFPKPTPPPSDAS
jgi:hypothetical protein